MKKSHNYIVPLPPREQKALYQWYTISAYLVIGLITILVLVNVVQYSNIKKIQNTYHTLRASAQHMQLETQQSELLQREEEELQNRIAKIESIKNKQSYNPITSLQELAQHIPANVCITEFMCSKNNKISFQGYAQTAESAVLFLSKLQQLPTMKHLQLASLTPLQFQNNDKTWYQFHVK